MPWRKHASATASTTSISPTIGPSCAGSSGSMRRQRPRTFSSVRASARRRRSRARCWSGRCRRGWPSIACRSHRPGQRCAARPRAGRSHPGKCGKPHSGSTGTPRLGQSPPLRRAGSRRALAAACDLPEPTLFRERFGVAETYAGAGLELSALHFGLWLLAWPVRLGLLKTLRPAATPLAWIADRLRALGSDKGGLRIDLAGPGASRCWSLIAEGGDGPYVPAMPAAALVRKLARGDLGRRGAMPCVGLLSLADIESEWLRAHLRIASGWGEDGASFRPSLYRRVLGRNYGGCLSPVSVCTTVWAERGVDAALSLAQRTSSDGSWRSSSLCRPLFGMRPSRWDFKVREGRETWIRRVGGRSMRSEQSIGRRRPAGWLVEHFGPFAFDLRVT